MLMVTIGLLLSLVMLLWCFVLAAVRSDIWHSQGSAAERPLDRVRQHSHAA